MKREIKLANPRGFCAGVDRAIEIVNQALLKFGPPVYVRHEVVHNRNVVEDLKSKGAIFVEQIDEIPEGAITCLLYTSPSPRDGCRSRMPSSA